MKSLKTPLSFTQDLSVAALSYSSTFSLPFKLGMITLHASTGITETITITLDSYKGANYDTVLRTKTLVGETDFVFIPDGDMVFHAGDVLKIECTAANLTGIVYGEVKALEIG